MGGDNLPEDRDKLKHTNITNLSQSPSYHKAFMQKIAYYENFKIIHHFSTNHLSTFI